MGSGVWNDKDRFLAVLKINSAVCAAELFLAWYSGSLSMASDGFHVSLHVIVALVALASLYQFMGFSAEKIKKWSAGINISLFFPLAVTIAYEANQRLHQPLEINITSVFFMVAILGLIANIYTIHILHETYNEEHSDNENRFLLLIHMVFDALGSIIVIAGGIIIAWEITIPAIDLHKVDPIASFILSGLIVIGALLMSWKLFHGHGHVH